MDSESAKSAAGEERTSESLTSRLFLALPPALLVLGGVLLFARAPYWWMGAGFLAASCTLLAKFPQNDWSRFRQWLDAPAIRRLPYSRAAVIAELFCIAAVLGVSVALFRDAIWDRIVSDDHPVHYFRAWQFENELLKTGRLRGWVQGWYAGYPQNYLYPFGGDLWVVAVHALGLGLLSLSHAYALAVWLMWSLFGYAHYRLGARFSGRAVGLIAALIGMTDVGGGRGGGISQLIQVGVWPQALSVAFCTLAVSRLAPLYKGEGWRHAAAFGVCMGCSLLSHANGLIFFAAATPLAVLVACSGAAEAPKSRVLSRLLVASFIGACIGALYVLPLFSVADEMMKSGVAWLDARSIGEKAVQADVVAGLWPFAFVLGTVGTFAGLVSRRPGLRFAAICVVALVALAGGSVLHEFNLDALAKGLQQTQFQRYVILAKPLFFVLAGHTLVTVFVSMAHKRDSVVRPTGIWGDAAIAFVAGVLLAPMIFGFVSEYAKTKVHPALKTETERPHAAARKQLVSWLKKNLPTGEFYRVASQMASEEVDLATEIERPIYVPAGWPASVVRDRIRGKTNEVLTAVNTKYLVETKPRRGNNFKELKTFGPYRVYEYLGFNPDVFSVRGKGKVKVLDAARDELVLEAEPGSTGTLVIHYCPFPRWKGWRNDEPIDIGQTRLDSRTLFMSVPLEPGRYRFEFTTGAADVVAGILSLVGILLAMGFALLDTSLRRLEPVRDRLAALEVRLARIPERLIVVSVAVLVGVLLVASSVLAAWSAKSGTIDRAFPNLSGVVYDFGARLGDASASVGARKPRRCRWEVDRFQCSGAEAVLRLSNTSTYSVHRCVRISLDAGTTLMLQYEKGRGGKVLAGFAALVGRTSPARLTIRDARGEVLSRDIESTRTTTFQAKRDRFDALKFTFEPTSARASSLCFYAQLFEG